MLTAVDPRGEHLDYQPSNVDVLWRVIAKGYIPVVYRVRFDTQEDLVSVFHTSENKRQTFGLPIVINRQQWKELPRLLRRLTRGGVL